MNTPKPASEILSMEDRVDTQKKYEGFGILKTKFRMLIMGLVLSGCSSPAPVSNQTLPKPMVVLEKIEVLTCPEIPTEVETPVTENIQDTIFNFSGPSLQTLGYHPFHQQVNTLAASSFRAPEEISQKQSVSSPLKVKTPNQEASFSIAPANLQIPQNETVPDRYRYDIPTVQRQNAPQEHPQELIYLYLLFTTFSFAAASMVGYERLQARKIQKILAELQHGRL